MGVSILIFQNLVVLIFTKLSRKINLPISIITNLTFARVPNQNPEEKWDFQEEIFQEEIIVKDISKREADGSIERDFCQDVWILQWSAWTTHYSRRKSSTLTSRNFLMSFILSKAIVFSSTHRLSCIETWSVLPGLSMLLMFETNALFCPAGLFSSFKSELVNWFLSILEM